MKDSNLVKSVIKAMTIYETLIANKSPLSLSKLSNKLNINISTVHRLINTLLELGYVDKNEEGLYMLGHKSYKIAETISQSFSLKNIAHPFLQEIASKCNETTNLVVLENQQVMYIDQVESTNMVRMFASPGSIGPAYCTGSGKALLAYVSDQELESYFKNNKMVPYTDYTITEPEKLKKELKKIREQKYSLDLEELEKGVRCVAVPVLDRNNSALAAISVSGPKSRVTMDYLNNTLLPLVREKASELENIIRSKE